MVDIELFVFDVAGTTVSDEDHAVARCVCEAVRAVGADVAEADVNPVMGMPKPLAIRKLLEQARGACPSPSEAAQVHADFQRRMIEHYRSAPGIRPAPGAEELFATLRSRGVRVALDTGFDRIILNTILTRLRWSERIDYSVTSDEVEHGRPAPDMIYAAMRAVGVTDAKSVAKVGDSESDIQQGLAAGCGLVAAVMGARTRPIIARYPDVQPVEQLSDLLRLFEKQPTGAPR